MIDNIQLENIRRTLDEVEKAVGHNWMENWVHTMRDHFGRLGQNIPPLALAWLKAKDELAAAEFHGHGAFSHSTKHILLLGSNLKILKNIKGFQRQLPLLRKDTPLFLSTCFRLMVAANYYSKGYSLILHSGQYTADIEIQTSNGPVSVVTKTINAQNTSQLFTLLSQGLSNTLHKIDKGVIYFEIPLPPGYTTKLLPQITDMIKVNNATIVIASPDYEQLSLKYVYNFLNNKPSIHK